MGKYGKKKGGGGPKGKKKRKHHQYYDIFDAAQDAIEDKVDSAAKDVSYLDRDGPKETQVDEEPVAPEGPQFEENEVFEEKWTSPYESLLSSLHVAHDQDNKKRSLKKRKAEQKSQNSDAPEASDEPKSKKVKISEPQSSKNAESDEMDADEVRESDMESDSDVDPEDYERELHERHLALSKNAADDSDRFNTAEELDTEDDNLTLLEMEEVKGDPFEAHLDRIYTKIELEQRSERKLHELPEHEAVGRIWADSIDSMPRDAANAKYYMKPRTIPRWNKFFDETVDTTSKRAKKRERRRLRAMASASGSSSEFDVRLNEQQHVLLSFITQYQDLLYCARTHENALSTMSVYAAHALNHVLKTRDLILKHNNILTQHALAKKEKGKPKPEAPEFKDQGFTRPKVLVILPMRNSCLEFVDVLLQLAPKTQADRVANKNKFYEEFFDEVFEPKSQKPLDYLATFRGNTDDAFRLGISFAKKHIKLYSEFYSSDIIVCSPLGLRLAIEDSQQGNFDFLSSIEMVIVDQAEVLLMQNWAHLEFIFERLNQMPKKPHETDFSRVRQWYLDEQMKFYRQTLIFSRISHVDINFIMNRFCHNVRGRVKISEDYRSLNSVALSLVTRQLRQVFHRVNCDAFADADDARFEYFSTQIYNHVRSTLGKGTLIYVPSYFDYVRLKNFLKKKADEEVNEEISIAFVSEYTKTPDASRSRTRLFKEQLHIMVYTERYHFYHRFMFRGVKNVVFYSPPQLPHFYSEMVNLMADDGTCLCLFTKFDVYQLEPIVGVKRSERMLTSDKSTFLFC